MNLFEAGAIPGAVAGAVVGGVICKSHGLAAVLGGTLLGAVAGGFAGWIYALGVITLTAFMGVLWTAARKRSHAQPTDKENARMNRVACPGVFVGVVTGALLIMNWPYALMAMLLIALVVAIVTGTLQQCGDKARRHP